MKLNFTISTLKFCRTLYLLTVLIFSANTSFGQINSSPVQNLDSVVIQNERLHIPYSKQNRDIVILSRAEIKATPAKSVNELLSYVAGIDVRQRGSMGAQADISINGGTADESLVLLNGMKLKDAQTGHNMMNIPINMNAIKRIEILKGSAADTYGVDAINGAINIITRQPEKSGVSTNIYTGTSFKTDSLSHHTYAGLGVEANASLTSEQTKHFLSVGTTQSNGYRHNTSIDTKKLFYRNHLDFKRTQLKVMGGYMTNTYGANGFYSAPKDEDAKEQVKTTLAAVDGTVNVSDRWTLKPSLNYRYSDDNYVLDKRHPETYQNTHYTNTFEAKLNNSFSTNSGAFGLGVAYRNSAIASNGLGHHSRHNLGIFTNYSLDFIPKTTINLGIYANYNNAYGWNWMPALDFGYQVSQALRLFANANTGLRLPTYTDLYYEGPTNNGNPDLTPEKSWQTSAGIKYHHGRFRTSVEYFYRQTHDFIDWVKAIPDDPWLSENYQRIKTQGLSLSANYYLFPKIQNQNFNLSTHWSYTYLHPKLTKHSSKKLSHYALENLKHQLSGKLTFHLFHHINLSFNGKYEKRLNYKDYFLLATRLSTDIKAFNIYIDADNLGNVQYTEAGAVPMPGRWITIGLKWEWWKTGS